MKYIGQRSSIGGVKVERAPQVEGHDGKALAFEDWSIKNYLKPDPKLATRVTLVHDPRLNPPFPFKVKAWIYPTAQNPGGLWRSVLVKEHAAAHQRFVGRAKNSRRGE